MITPSVQHDLLPDLGRSRSFVPSTFTGKCNAHIHLPPNFSAFETPDQAIELARRDAIDVLGVSNYYDYSVYGEFARLACNAGIFPIYGIEILAMQEDLRAAEVKVNDPGNPGKTYLCGKGITRFSPDVMTPQAAHLLAQIRGSDSRRMAQMIARLARIFAERGVATGLDHEAVIERVVRRHGSPRDSVYLQERHAAQAFQERLFELVPDQRRAEMLSKVLGVPSSCDSPVKVQNDIRSHLMKAGKPAFVDETYVTFEDAVTLVRELGGIPCYPVLADGAQPICGFEQTPQKLTANLKARNIHAVEFIPVRNTPEVLSQYVTVLRDAGLIVTAGTEHNTLELIPIEPTCVNGASIPDPAAAIFREGACVVAAHQYLTLRGERGYTGEPGQIDEYASLGSAVIHAYRKTTTTP